MKTRLSRKIEKEVVDRLLELLKSPQHWAVGPAAVWLDRKLYESRITEGDFEKKMARMFALSEDIQFWRGINDTPLHFKLWRPEIRFRLIPRLKLWWGVRKMLVAKLNEKQNHAGKALIWHLNRAKDRSKEPPPEPPKQQVASQTPASGPFTLGASASPHDSALLQLAQQIAALEATYQQSWTGTTASGWSRVPGAKEMGEL